MCAIFGAVLNEKANAKSSLIFNHIALASTARGRDGYGFASYQFFRGAATELYQEKYPGTGYEEIELKNSAESIFSFGRQQIIIGNMRAEPTTEYVESKYPQDQQPYTLGDWSIVHNGTIANDKELRTNEYHTTIDSAAIVEQLDKLSNKQIGRQFGVFCEVITSLKGSFAIIAMNRSANLAYVAANYRPLWWIQTEAGVYFASSRDFFPDDHVPQMLPPYTVAAFTDKGIYIKAPLYKDVLNNKALVVCSGGLDSVVSAAWAQHMGMEVELIHFRYGSRAEGPEVQAIQRVAEHMGVPLKFMPLPVYSKEDSPLLDPDSKVAGGEAGAEFAHEWVPARNLLLLSVATAYAEARGCHTLVLGNNLEEAGAYPDNEPEFIARFNDLLPFAIGDGKRLQVIMPVGNMMKHEIVALGKKVSAPMHLTWSCYRAHHDEGGKYIHCGKCGPCFMRRTAFEINKLDEVIDYEL